MAAPDGHLNAMRHEGQPLQQPLYNFSKVPKAQRDLSGSSLQRIDQREHFQACMAEMLLLCKEAIRRRPNQTKSTGSKPLSLDYMADRLDIDDPCFGYLVRTADAPTTSLNSPSRATRSGQPPTPSRKHKGPPKGMLQGFVTVTTFTNWHATFCWNSLHEASFRHDASPDRITDTPSGQLAAELQATVHAGHVWNEGIVWPRIAEVSLLGGLGCGRALISMVLEDLEGMKPSAKHNYDYVIIHATDNSISFYESMGFVRVGALVRDDEDASSSKGGAASERNNSMTSSTSSSSSSGQSSGDDEEAVAVVDTSPEKPNAIAAPLGYVTSSSTSYAIRKPGETPNEIAKKLKVDVWDLVFLNRAAYPEIIPSSRLLVDTMLRVPVYPKRTNLGSPRTTRRTVPEEKPEWYVAKNNETPRMIAKQFQVSCTELIAANRARLPGLLSSSRLMEGTRIQVSHFHVVEEQYKPYSHWTFPDESFEEGEPSYMMAYKLNRRRGGDIKRRPFAESLAVPVSEYTLPDTSLLAPASPVRRKKSPPQPARSRASAVGAEPVPPKRALNPFAMFSMEQRQNNPAIEGMDLAKSSRYIGDLWKALSESEKAKYDDRSTRAREQYYRDKEKYESELHAYHLALGPAAVAMNSSSAPATTSTSASSKVNLYNCVVRLKPGAMTENSEYKYWFVLTYIPDLKWCHLAPMVQDGTFGADKKKSRGRPRWKLVDEKLGKEVDISSSFCIPIKNRSMKRTLDADKEEWDIIDDGTLPTFKESKDPSSPTKGRGRGRPRSTNRNSNDRAPRRDRAGTAIKPSVERKRKRKFAAIDPTNSIALQPLVATLPGSRRNWTVRITMPSVASSPQDRLMAELPGATNVSQVRLTGAAIGAKRRGRPPGSGSKHRTDSLQRLPAPSAAHSAADLERLSRRLSSSGQKRRPGRPRKLKDPPVAQQDGPPAMKRYVDPSIFGTSSESHARRRGRPRKHSPVRRRGQPGRPKRSAAPTYLGEDDSVQSASWTDERPFTLGTAGPPEKTPRKRRGRAPKTARSASTKQHVKPRMSPADKHKATVAGEIPYLSCNCKQRRCDDCLNCSSCSCCCKPRAIEDRKPSARKRKAKESPSVEPPRKRGRPPKNKSSAPRSKASSEPQSLSCHCKQGGCKRQRCADCGVCTGRCKCRKSSAQKAPSAVAPKRLGRPPKNRPAASPPKRRGRPPKNQSASSPPKRRGRPPKNQSVASRSSPFFEFGADQMFHDNGRPRRSAAPLFLGEGQAPILRNIQPRPSLQQKSLGLGEMEKSRASSRASIKSSSLSCHCKQGGCKRQRCADCGKCTGRCKCKKPSWRKAPSAVAQSLSCQCKQGGCKRQRCADCGVCTGRCKCKKSSSRKAPSAVAQSSAARKAPKAPPRKAPAPRAKFAVGTFLVCHCKKGGCKRQRCAGCGKCTGRRCKCNRSSSRSAPAKKRGRPRVSAPVAKKQVSAVKPSPRSGGRPMRAAAPTYLGPLME